LVIILISRKNNSHPAHLNRGNTEHPETTENRKIYQPSYQLITEISFK